MNQLRALEILKSGANVFLTGRPGAGKTYVVNKFTQWCNENSKRVAITASTGIAASHIGGTTIHSWTGIKMKTKITLNHLGDMEGDRFLVDRIQRSDVLVIDEISMLDSNFIDMIDEILRHFKRGDEPFGGMQMVFVGDFFQLPPVSKGNKPRMAFEGYSWQHADLKICYLTEQHRQADQVFLEILDAMREGRVNEDHKKALDLAKRNVKPRTHLFTHNFDVDEMNALELAKLPGISRDYTATLSGRHPTAIDILKRQVLSPEILKLKVDAPVIFTRNHKEGKFVNGTVGKVIAFDQSQVPIIRTFDGSEIIPQREKWTLEEGGQERASFTQYPLKLAWAITVHKSQGMSLDEASVDLSKCFEYGQGYVALSRLRSLAGLHLESIGEKAFLVSPKVMRYDAELKKLSE